jgi:hypothetical protein
MVQPSAHAAAPGADTWVTKQLPWEAGLWFGVCVADPLWLPPDVAAPVALAWDWLEATAAASAAPGLDPFGVVCSRAEAGGLEADAPPLGAAVDGPEAAPTRLSLVGPVLSFRVRAMVNATARSARTTNAAARRPETRWGHLAIICSPPFRPSRATFLTGETPQQARNCNHSDSVPFGGRRFLAVQLRSRCCRAPNRRIGKWRDLDNPMAARRR